MEVVIDLLLVVVFEKLSSQDKREVKPLDLLSTHLNFEVELVTLVVVRSVVDNLSPFLLDLISCLC